MNLSNTEPKRRDNEIPFIFRNFFCVYAEYLLKNLNGPNPFTIKIRDYRCVSKSLDPALLLLKLIVILRIQTYEDFDTNAPLLGIFFAVFDLMGKQFWVSRKSASIFVGVNESLSLSSLTSHTVGTHFIWNQANNSFFVMLHSKVSMLREFKNTNSQENSTKKWKIHSEDVS